MEVTVDPELQSAVALIYQKAFDKGFDAGAKAAHILDQEDEDANELDPATLNEDERAIWDHGHDAGFDEAVEVYENNPALQAAVNDELGAYLDEDGDDDHDAVIHHDGFIEGREEGWQNGYNVGYAKGVSEGNKDTVSTAEYASAYDKGLKAGSIAVAKAENAAYLKGHYDGALNMLASNEYPGHEARS